MYGAICFVGTLFVIFIVPETQGKTPEDMKRYFEGKKSPRKISGTQYGTDQAKINGSSNPAYENDKV